MIWPGKGGIIKNLTIRELPYQERPREKALQYGIESLSDSELLATILRTGSKKENAIGLANRLLAKYENLRRLATVSITELTQLKGIGKAKAIEIKACLEIAKRYSQITLRPGEKMTGGMQIFKYFHEKLRAEKREKFYVILLDSKNCIIRGELISIGSLNFSIVPPREIFTPAIRENAKSILLVHNHPSGDPSPSSNDIVETRRVVRAGKLLATKVLDHIIIGNGCYVSFLEQGLMD